MLERGIAHCSPNEGGSGTCGDGAKSLSGGIGGISPDDSANGSEQRHGPRGDRVSDEGHRGAGGCRGRVDLRRHDQFGWRQRSAVAPAPRVKGRLTYWGRPWKSQDGPKACARSIAQLRRLGLGRGEGALTSQPDPLDLVLREPLLVRSWSLVMRGSHALPIPVAPERVATDQ